MKRVREGKRSRMNGPAIYRIKVEGCLNASWSERIEGMNITSVEDATVLVGRLQDQAALSGVLNTLYELHFPVISVDCLENG